jgi:hypothetical protein
MPKLVCTKVTREADPCDRPQKIRIELFLSSMLHYKEACSSSQPCVDCKEVQINEKNKSAGPCDQPNPFTSYSSFICSIDLMDKGKLGYGFTSAAELEEVDIGPGDKPRPTFMWQNQSELHRLKYASPLLRATSCFKWYNPLACRVSSR